MPLPEFTDRHDGLPLKEKHDVPAVAPYKIYLKQLPSRLSVLVPGLVEDVCLPTAADRFFVEYRTATLYLPAEVAGQELLVSYTGCGSVLRAHDLQEIVDYMKVLAGRIADLKKELAAKGGFMA